MKKSHSALVYVLKALLPYSRENLALSFKPKLFFTDLERISGYSQASIETTYYRAKKLGFISNTPKPKLTELGEKKVKPFVAKKLTGNAKLMVIFDIPNDQNRLRREFRTILKSLGFKQVQKSVWMTKLDHKKTIKTAVAEMNLGRYIEVFEAARI